MVYMLIHYFNTVRLEKVLQAVQRHAGRQAAGRQLQQSTTHEEVYIQGWPKTFLRYTHGREPQ
jgi:hypothetical protein